MPPGAYEWREWDGEAVVFIHATGDTHALSVQATAVLAAMRAAPDVAQAADEWLDRAGCAPAKRGANEAEALMKGLAGIGLVQPAPP